MIRFLLLLGLLLPALAQAAASTVRIEPATPLLGKPLTIVIPLPEPEMVLAGLPDLGPFEPLAPPLRTATELRLVVLPMRPGLRTIPPFPLQIGHARSIETAALTVTVLEGIAPEASPAPLKGRPLPLIGTDRRGLIVSTFVLVLGGALLWGRRRRQGRRFEELPPAVQLQRLQRHLNRIPYSPQTVALRRKLDQHRFGPIPIAEDELRELREAILPLTKGGR